MPFLTAKIESLKARFRTRRQQKEHFFKALVYILILTLDLPTLKFLRSFIVVTRRLNGFQNSQCMVGFSSPEKKDNLEVRGG